MLENDSPEAALPSIMHLSDERFRHFYDPDQRVGKEIARSIGWEGYVAWDIYLFYGPNSGWKNGPPSPTRWMHQLKDSWADKTNFRTGDNLVDALVKSMAALSPK